MANPIQDLNRRFEELKNEVRGITGGPQLGNSSLEDGVILEYDGFGDLVAGYGKQHDGSHVSAPFVGPTPPVPVPASLVAGPGVLEVRWNGKFVGDAVATMDWSHAAIYVGVTPDFEPDWSDQEATLRGLLGDLALLRREAGTYYVRLASWSLTGKRSSASDAMKIVVPAAADADEIGQKLTEIEGKADQATSAAADANQVAGQADSKAVEAKSAADQAAADALTAAGIAAGKGKVLTQSTAPGAADRNAQTLWIDTTGGANTPKCWVSDSTWVAVSDKVAVDAAAKAALAEADAAAAKLRADQAFANAQSAMTAAGQAQSSANGKNNVYYRDVNPSGSGFVIGDTLFIRSAVGQPITAHRQWDGAAWKDVVLGHQIIASVDLGKATVGELDGVYIKAGTVAVNRLIVGSYDNLTPEPDFRAGGAGWSTLHADATISQTGARNGGPVLAFQANGKDQICYANRIRCAPDASFRLSATVKTSKVASGDYLWFGIRFVSDTGSFSYGLVASPSSMPANTWVTVTGMVKAPANAISMDIRIGARTNWSGGGEMLVDYVDVTRAGDGSIVVDGLMDAKTITAPLIQTTNSSNRGLKWKDDGLYAYNGVGTETFRLLASTGEASFLGRIRSGSEIDGATITGGLIQTRAGVDGIKLSGSEIRANSAEGDPIFWVNTDAKMVQLTGVINVTTPDGRGWISIQPDAVSEGWTADAAVIRFGTGDTTESAPASIYVTSDGDAANKNARLNLWSPKRGSSVPRASLQLVSSATGLNSAAYLTSGAGNSTKVALHGTGRIELTAPAGIDLVAPDVRLSGKVSFVGDSDWSSVTLTSQALLAGGVPPRIRKRLGTVEVEGNIHGNGLIAGQWVTIFTMPAGLRPSITTIFPATSNTNAGMALNVLMDGKVQAWVNIATQAWVPLASIRFSP